MNEFDCLQLCTSSSRRLFTFYIFFPLSFNSTANNNKWELKGKAKRREEQRRKHFPHRFSDRKAKKGKQPMMENCVCIVKCSRAERQTEWCQPPAQRRQSSESMEEKERKGMEKWMKYEYIPNT